MKLFSPIATTVAALGFAQTSYSLVSFHPDGGPTYSVGLPKGSSISGSSTGPIYFSLSAPDSYRWVGFGFGDQMARAEIFVMYADGSGNVTISPRAGGGGHVEPQVDNDLAQGVELLAGSGIEGGVMKANVRCTTCKLASSDLSSVPFISAWFTGSPINSPSISATISQHNGNSYRQFSFDLSSSSASIASDTNPFVSSSPAASSGSKTTGTATSAASSATGTSSSGSSSSGDDGGSSGDDGDSGNSGVVVTGGGAAAINKINKYNKAHGIIMGLAVVVLFPLGSILQRVVGGIVLHGLVQLFALAMLIAGFGLGLELGHLTNLKYQSTGKTHTIFGTVIFALFLIQPFLGLVHHMLYKKHNSRTPVSHVHIWFGRILMICGVINGGLGLKLAANTTGGEIAYGVVVGVVALIYTFAVILKRKGTNTKTTGREKIELRSRDGSS